MQLPVNESYVVLTAGEATGRRCRDAIVAAAVQLKHLVRPFGTRHDNSMKLGTSGKLNHRRDDSLARGRRLERVHDWSPFNSTIGRC